MSPDQMIDAAFVCVFCVGNANKFWMAFGKKKFMNVSNT
jgi:hypothetical protein